MGTERSRTALTTSDNQALSTAHLNARRTVDSFLRRHEELQNAGLEDAAAGGIGNVTRRASLSNSRYNEELQNAVDLAAQHGKAQRRKARSSFLEEQRLRSELPEVLELPEELATVPQNEVATGLTVSHADAARRAEREDAENRLATHVADGQVQRIHRWQPPPAAYIPQVQPEPSRGLIQDLLDEQARNWGVRNVQAGLQRCASGGFLEFVGGSKDILVGVLKGCCEFLGLNDIARGVKALFQGHLLEAMLGIGFGCWSLVSLGAVGLARKAIVLGFQAAARAIGLETFKSLAKKMAEDFLKTSVDTIVQAATEELSVLTAKGGSAVVIEDVVKGCTTKFVDKLIVNNPAIKGLGSEALQQLNEALCQQATFQLAHAARKTVADGVDVGFKYGLRLVADKYSAEGFAAFLSRNIYSAPKLAESQLKILEKVALMNKGGAIAEGMLPELSKRITVFCDHVGNTFAVESTERAAAACRNDILKTGLKGSEQLLPAIRKSTNAFCAKLFSENPILNGLGENVLKEYQTQMFELVSRNIISGAKAEVAASHRALFTRLALTLAEHTEGPVLSPALRQVITHGTGMLGLDAEKLASRWTGRVMSGYLKKMGLDELTKFHTLKILDFITRAETPQIVERFGVPQHVAWLMKVWVGKPMLVNDLGGGAVLIAGAFEYQKWLLAPVLGNIRNRIVDRPLKKIFISEISAVVQKELLDGGMREGFQLTLRKGLDQLATRTGMTQNLMRVISEGAERGFATALTECITKLVEKGVKDAFKIWRRAFPFMQGDALSMHQYRNRAPSLELARMESDFEHAGLVKKQSFRSKLFRGVLGKKTWRRRKDGKFDSEDEQIV
ncbi:MAG: hypothetical protein K1X83_11790 [Oligoflexia bacterium]|nr:hypothetical protein [Oligoflexia bacterium]